MTNFLSPVKSRPEGKFTSPEKFISPLKARMTPLKPQVTPLKEPEVKDAPPPLNIKHLYRVIQKSSGAVGGYGHNGPVYGEITMGTFDKIVHVMKKHTAFDASSSFVDIGSGLGKPNLHVALHPGVKLSCGIEVEELRWQLSMHNLRFVMDQVPDMRRNVVYFAHADATKMDLHDFSHVYMFDVGFPPAVLLALSKAFNSSKSAKALVSFQRPDKLKKIGFAIREVGRVLTRMNGSTEGHTAYVFVKDTTQGLPSRLTDYFSPTKAAADKGSPAKPEPVEKSAEKPVTKTSVRTTRSSKANKLSVMNKDKQQVVDEVLKKSEQVVKKSERVLKKVVEEVLVKEAGLALFRKMDYEQYVAETGLVGIPGERSQRAAAAVRKNYKC